VTFTRHLILCLVKRDLLFTKRGKAGYNTQEQGVMSVLQLFYAAPERQFALRAVIAARSQVPQSRKQPEPT
jgi:hypothetical protein